MKTNLVDLMSKVSQLEKEYCELGYDLRPQSMNTRIIELDGKSQMLEEYPDFQEKFNKYLEIGREITELKGIIFQKNNSLTLQNENTIQKTLVDIQNRRKALDLVKTLARQNPSKRRNTEVNNSYFTSKELAYDKDLMIRIETELTKDIQNLEFEISQLNSQTFEIGI